VTGLIGPAAGPGHISSDRGVMHETAPFREPGEIREPGETICSGETARAGPA
jgi:hypothetical protein